jgi:hypothetical protein
MSICSLKSEVALISRSAQRDSEKMLFFAIAALIADRYSASYRNQNSRTRQEAAQSRDRPERVADADRREETG